LYNLIINDNNLKARTNGNKKRIRIIILWCLGVGKNEVLVTVILDVLLVVGNYKKITITQEWRNEE